MEKFIFYIECPRIYYVAELFAKAMVKSLTPENIIDSFRRTGIFLFDSGIFTEAEFLSSTVTEQPHRPTTTSTNESSAQSGWSHTLVHNVKSPKEKEAFTGVIFPRLYSPKRCFAFFAIFTKS